MRRTPTEAKFKARADAMVSGGPKDHGFLYVSLDDFYQKCDSGSTSRPADGYSATPRPGETWLIRVGPTSVNTANPGRTGRG
ncbi:hypothetical protein [Streptomyces sp. NPDC059994]|uniref:hypothetical protein n=1 Tax=Streptomyces sp. NPDC059994 TaxID=3347029 RepID=UPI0036A0DDCF